MLHQLQGVTWLFLDPSVLLNEVETDRELRRLVGAAMARRGRPVELEEVERAWMQAISAPQAIMPLPGAVRTLARDQNTAAEILTEVKQSFKNLDTLFHGTQIALTALQSKFRLGVIAPHWYIGTRQRLERFHLVFPVMALCDEQQLSYKLEQGSRPDPALFVWALRKAGIPASQAAYCSDRVDLALAPAKAAGLTTIWARQTNYKLRVPRIAQETPDLTYNSLADFAHSV